MRDECVVPPEATNFARGFQFNNVAIEGAAESSEVLKRLFIPPEFPLLGAPRAVDVPKLLERADVCFIGVPSGVGTPGPVGCQLAPLMLRTFSRHFALWFDPVTLKCFGWYDYVLSRTLGLESVLLDLGDIVLPRGLSATQHYMRVQRAVREVRRCAPRARLVFLGGDHAITLPVIAGLHNALSEFGGSPPEQDSRTILHVDAHQDALAGGQGNAYGALNSANVMRILDSAEGVHQIVQFGLRGVVPRKAPTPPNTRCVRTFDELGDALKLAREIHVSIDVDVLDPAIVSGVAAPVPFGWTSKEVYDLHTILGSVADRVSSMDIVELDPHRDQTNRSTHAVLFAMLVWLGALCG